MNERKLKKLFERARGETPPVPPEDFGTRVMREVRREPRATAASLWEQLEHFFPRLAFTMMLLIGLCLAADFGYSWMEPSSLSDEVTELSAQGLLAANEGNYE